MTEYEAYEAKVQIQSIPQKIWDQLSPVDNKAMSMAYNALLKQIPMKIKRWKDGHACCGNCERGVLREDKYCCYCGQRIDWTQE